MKARFNAYCGHCNQPIAVGQEIERNANARAGANFPYSHARCRPAAGKVYAARFRVVLQGSPRADIPDGNVGQYVNRKTALSRAMDVLRSANRSNPFAPPKPGAVYGPAIAVVEEIG